MITSRMVLLALLLLWLQLFTFVACVRFTLFAPANGQIALEFSSGMTLYKIMQ